MLRAGSKRGDTLDRADRFSGYPHAIVLCDRKYKLPPLHRRQLTLDVRQAAFKCFRARSPSVI